MSEVVEISIGNVNGMLEFIGASEHLPPGWTVARVAHLVSRVQGEAAATKADQTDNDADDQAEGPLRHRPI